jgi:hypothetical protein
MSFKNGVERHYIGHIQKNCAISKVDKNCISHFARKIFLDSRYQGHLYAKEEIQVLSLRTDTTTIYSNQ